MATKKMAATPKKKVVKAKKLKYSFSPNKKLNAVLNGIADDLLRISDTRKGSISEVKRYKREFPRELDYNIAQYGNMLIYYYDVREFYKKHGYASMEKMSDSKVWETYKRQVGWVVRNCEAFK